MRTLPLNTQKVGKGVVKGAEEEVVKEVAQEAVREVGQEVEKQVGNEVGRRLGRDGKGARPHAGKGSGKGGGKGGGEGGGKKVVMHFRSILHVFDILSYLCLDLYICSHMRLVFLLIFPQIDQISNFFTRLAVIC